MFTNIASGEDISISMKMASVTPIRATGSTTPRFLINRPSTTPLANSKKIHMTIIKLTPNWTLYSPPDPNTPGTLKNNNTGRVADPSDQIKLFSSWKPQPAAQAVRRASGAFATRHPESEMVHIYKFCAAYTKAQKQGHIHIRVEMSQKNAFVKAAQAQGLTLSNWILKTLNQSL